MIHLFGSIIFDLEAISPEKKAIDALLNPVLHSSWPKDIIKEAALTQAQSAIFFIFFGSNYITF